MIRRPKPEISAGAGELRFDSCFDEEAAPLVGLSLAAAGDMIRKRERVGEARTPFLERLGFDPARAAALYQTHSRTVVDLRPATDPSGAEGDGFVSAAAGRCLTVTVADCMPIYLYDPVSGAFALVHSGWKGTGIVVEALWMMQRLYEAESSDVSAILGPCIGPCCYEVDEARAAEYAKLWGKNSVSRDGAKPRLDLRQANINLLTGLGVPKITVIDACTACNPAFGSYRREGAGNFRHMMAFLGRPTDNAR